jgi:hypothetical protein
MGLEGKKRISRLGALCNHLLGPRLLGRVRNRRSPEECGGEESRRRAAMSAK